MKTKITFFGLFMLIVVGIPLMGFAQYYGNGNVTGREFNTGDIHSINASGNFQVEIIQSDETSVYVETDDNLFDHIQVKEVNGKLSLSTLHIRKSTKLKAIVTTALLQSVEASGAAFIESPAVVEAEKLTIKASGASTVVMILNADELVTQISGASKLTLSGFAAKHNALLSGASKLKASELKTETTSVKASGASDAKVWAEEALYHDTSGASKVRWDKTPNSLEKNEEIVNISQSYPSGWGDTVSVNVGNMKVKVIENDSTKIIIGNRTIIVDDRGNVNVKRTKKHRFNGHWAGFELGINGLLTPDFNMSYPAGQTYLDLRMEKSINVNLNFYEQNITLNKSGTFGMFSGLGLSWNNYRFSKPVMVSGDSDTFKGYFMEGISVRKSKLTNLYLTLPLFLEVQSKAFKTKDKLHFAAGVVAGWRISSHTKIYYEEANKEFSLRDAETGELSVMQSPGNSSRNISKNYDNFYMRPFKLDASVRAGWGIVNVYANYSLTSLFIKDKGPEVYPFAVGISLTSW
ncbi:MAG: DUF2807 domain-containing protein [Bacteroidetes bacterium]|nr:DUF2807 domain-containing protein [Bacteroidota bacterium]MBU1578843.1 DUF2807 domain-containing protein [Bacteroidota bacterium]MBU2558453.1 DUF2807 domain-containing protein [Bacteroidota bacterium]